MTYRKAHVPQFYYTPQGEPKLHTPTTEFSPTNFDELFIQMLSDYTQHMEPTDDALQHAHEFRDIYIQCMLDALHEYNPEIDYSLP